MAIVAMCILGLGRIEERGILSRQCGLSPRLHCAKIKKIDVSVSTTVQFTNVFAFFNVEVLGGRACSQRCSKSKRSCR